MKATIEKLTVGKDGYLYVYLHFPEIERDGQKNVYTTIKCDEKYYSELKEGLISKQQSV